MNRAVWLTARPLQVFEKLRMLSKSQLELILLFLKQMQGSAMNFQRIEKMMPRMFDAVDMAVVQILAHYDRTQFQVRPCIASPARRGTLRWDHTSAPRLQPPPRHLLLRRGQYLGVLH